MGDARQRQQQNDETTCERRERLNSSRSSVVWRRRLLEIEGIRSTYKEKVLDRIQRSNGRGLWLHARVPAPALRVVSLLLRRRRISRSTRVERHDDATAAGYRSLSRFFSRNRAQAPVVSAMPQTHKWAVALWTLGFLVGPSAFPKKMPRSIEVLGQSIETFSDFSISSGPHAPTFYRHRRQAPSPD